MGGWRNRATGGTAAIAMTAGLVTVAVVPAQADVDPTSNLVISEVYGGGGNAGATFTNDFIELFNTGTTPASLAGFSVQYAAATGTNWSGVIPLSGTIPGGGTYLVAGASQASVGAALPTPDASGSVNLSASNGNVALVNRATELTCATTACATDDAVIDLVGYGTGMASAGPPAPAPPDNTVSIARNAARANTVNNQADFALLSPPTPQGTGGGTPPSEPPADPTTVTPITSIQGGGAASPLAGQTVRTRGVVTATYPVGGVNGYVLQTPGTGGAVVPTATTPSPALSVFQPAGAITAQLGEYREVTGSVSEFTGLTQITVAADRSTVLTETAPPVTETTVTGWPTTDELREPLESVLFTPTGGYTVSNVFNANNFSEIGLAFGSTPLIQPTEVADAGTPAYAEAIDANARRQVAVDDGATTNFLSTANRAQTPPYVSLTNPVRVGAATVFPKPVIVDFRNMLWKFQPTSQVTTATAPADRPGFTDTRTDAPDDSVLTGAELSVASFNVLNYFTTLGENTAGCQSFKDRAGNPITVSGGCDLRGAFRAEDLTRQQDKIVKAINATDADVTGLMEIENSARLGEPADEAVGTLVTALNTDAGRTKWVFNPSSPDLAATATQQDVISNAIIYQPAKVNRLGEATALTRTAAPAFQNAREPIGQAFTPAGGGKPFFVAVNHFKSKGSGAGADADQGDGQGRSNASRVAQATALRDWVPTVLAGYPAATPVTDSFLIGDFNAYTREDPLRVLYDAGYTDVNAGRGPAAEQSYSFAGLSGSLDHVLANDSALTRVTGADIWNINSGESVALEYSRFNYHGTLFYAPDPFRSSDHDPVIAGFSADAPVSTSTELSLLNINDFHGRIDANTVKFSGTIEGLRKAAGEDNTLLLSAGDNIGASLFASASQQDQPTIDVLNALELRASAIGNHEFDAGEADLRDRVTAGGTNAGFGYLGANVYRKGTTTPAFTEYEVFPVDGVDVAVIGAVTQETPSLVSPSGVANLDFGDPVDAVNRVAAQLSDGNPANGEADVIVAEYHEGAGTSVPEGGTIESEIADGGAFAKIATDTSAQVDAIFTGHTHKEYVFAGPVPGEASKKRPIVQTGSYGERIGEITLTVDTTNGAVQSYTARNVPRVTTADADLVAASPRTAEVKRITDKALADAAVIGNRPVGRVTADITTAYSGGGYTGPGGTYVGGTRDDRAAESSLGIAIGNLLRDRLADRGAMIGVTNPGGLRADLLQAPDPVVTFGEANAVLPFANDLNTIVLTGAQFKAVLEQQYQTNADGTVPSRRYLALGLSDNVSYTYDDTAPAGSRITSITVNRAPIVATQDYTVATPSFLAQGGDNFRAFTQGRDRTDSGQIDRDALGRYLQDNDPLSPVFARRGVKVTGQPTGPVPVGRTATLNVAGLDLTSRGAPANTALTSTIDGSPAGTATVTAGAAAITVTVPAKRTGTYVLELTATPSGTKVRLPIQVVAAAVPTPAPTPTPTVRYSIRISPVYAQVRYGSRVRSSARVVTSDGGVVAGARTLYLTKNAGVTAYRISRDLRATATGLTEPRFLPPVDYRWFTRYLDGNGIARAESAGGLVQVRR